MASRGAGTGPKAVDLGELGGRVVSIFGKHVLIQMPAEVAEPLFGGKALGDARRSVLLDALERELADLRKRAPELADSALAASAVAMALEIEHPYNSATSKSMCQGQLANVLKELRALAPPEEKNDGLDEISAQRAKRRRGVADAADSARS